MKKIYFKIYVYFTVILCTNQFLNTKKRNSKEPVTTRYRYTLEPTEINAIDSLECACNLRKSIFRESDGARTPPIYCATAAVAAAAAAILRRVRRKNGD